MNKIFLALALLVSPLMADMENYDIKISSNLHPFVLLDRGDGMVTVNCNELKQYCEPKPLTTRWVKVETLGKPEWSECVVRARVNLMMPDCDRYGPPKEIELGLRSDGVVVWR